MLMHTLQIVEKVLFAGVQGRKTSFFIDYYPATYPKKPTLTLRAFREPLIPPFAPAGQACGRRNLMFDKSYVFSRVLAAKREAHKWVKG